MTKYGGGLLLLPRVMAFCCGGMVGESKFSGGHFQTFGSEIPGERSEGLFLDEVQADPAVILTSDERCGIQEENPLGYFTTCDTGADIPPGNGTYVTTVFGPDIFETFWFDAEQGSGYNKTNI